MTKVIGLDNINDYYDVNLKYARLSELGISREDIENSNSKLKIHNSKLSPLHSFYKVNLEAINHIFEVGQFDAVVNLAAQAGVRYSIENPHAYISSNILEACRNYNVKNLCI